MKTMLNLLTRLLELRRCCEHANENPQLTDGEKAAANFFKSLVRGCLPDSVLATYDRMKQTEPELLECPEVFAMAVLVSTYRSSSPVKRRELLEHFPEPEPAPSRGRRCGSAAKKRRCQAPKLPRHAAAALHA